METTCAALTIEQLRCAIRTVRESILSILVRMDHIMLQQIPQIRADYALKIGCWEQALLESELAARRARRRLALAQMQVNRGAEPQMDVIERQLDAELAEWMEKAELARIGYEQAIAFRTSMAPMTREESNELRRVYRALVKRLHPDVHAGADEDRTTFFVLVQEAYRRGDVAALRSLEVATRHLEPGEDDLDATDDEGLLSQELELARIEEDVTRERLRELEESEDMRLCRLLADAKWVTARTVDLRRAVEEWERVRAECDMRLKELRESHREH
ncbi:MAG: J domain-containing protein [Atopobiaceae bacterium]|nr:J domain-containing protein [Atopobiaceae bacterium]